MLNGILTFASTHWLTLYKFTHSSFIPSAFFPLSLLSYASIIGIVSTVFIIVILLFDGLTKTTAPGSIWDPAQTSLTYGNLGNLGVAFGLFMAGVSCDYS